MGLLNILDLVIGLAFVYFLLSLICVALQEIKARANNERSKNLKKWIFDPFRYDKERRDDQGLASRLWNNIIIDGLTQEGRSASYIPRDIFVSALLDEIHYESDDKYEKIIYKELQPLLELQSLKEKLETFKPVSESGQEELKELHKKGETLATHVHNMGYDTPEKINDRVKELETLLEDRKPYDFQSIGTSIRNSDLLPQRMKRAMLQIYQESHSNMDSFRDRLERWFDQAMERNAGTFKKKAQQSVLIFSILVTLLFNVDSIELIHYFYDHPAEAARVADAAEKAINDPNTAERLKSNNDDSVKTTLAGLRTSIDEVKALKLPIGWKGLGWFEYLDLGFWKVFNLLIGWALTVLAVSLGAPFWYDMLNKLVDLRSAGKKPAAAPGAVADSNKNVSDNPLG
ncbi:MAG TPA: hypothetical protein PK325_03100 [Cyclobacteriaceae bacterium]|nr:hypothetical protein [Cyclobacteriaceae bacterium]